MVLHVQYTEDYYRGTPCETYWRTCMHISWLLLIHFEDIAYFVETNHLTDNKCQWLTSEVARGSYLMHIHFIYLYLQSVTALVQLSCFYYNYHITCSTLCLLLSLLNKNCWSLQNSALMSVVTWHLCENTISSQPRRLFNHVCEYFIWVFFSFSKWNFVAATLLQMPLLILYLL